MIGAGPATPQSAVSEPAPASAIASRSEQPPLPGAASSAVVFTVIASAAGATTIATKHASNPTIEPLKPTIARMFTEKAKDS